MCEFYGVYISTKRAVTLGSCLTLFYRGLLKGKNLTISKMSAFLEVSFETDSLNENVA